MVSGASVKSYDRVLIILIITHLLLFSTSCLKLPSRILNIDFFANLCFGFVPDVLHSRRIHRVTRTNEYLEQMELLNIYIRSRISFVSRFWQKL